MPVGEASPSDQVQDPFWDSPSFPHGSLAGFFVVCFLPFSKVLRVRNVLGATDGVAVSVEGSLSVFLALYYKVLPFLFNVFASTFPTFVLKLLLSFFLKC